MRIYFFEPWHYANFLPFIRVKSQFLFVFLIIFDTLRIAYIPNFLIGLNPFTRASF
jgi:hypothetical protein